MWNSYLRKMRTSTIDTICDCKAAYYADDLAWSHPLDRDYIPRPNDFVLAYATVHRDAHEFARISVVLACD